MNREANKYSWKVIAHDDPFSKTYIEKMSPYFSNLPLRDDNVGTHIVIFYDEEIVGGVTLEQISSFSKDTDVLRHWKVAHEKEMVRILRLWSSRQTALTHIFHAITEVSSPHDFLYGILSLPLNFAQTCSEHFSNNHGWLIPEIPLEDCAWEPTLTPSSDGRKLLPIYIKFGAKFLGGAAGSECDSSVRVVMGMHSNEVILPKKVAAHA